MTTAYRENVRMATKNLENLSYASAIEEALSEEKVAELHGLSLEEYKGMCRVKEIVNSPQPCDSSAQKFINITEEDEKSAAIALDAAAECIKNADSALEKADNAIYYTPDNKRTAACTDAYDKILSEVSKTRMTQIDIKTAILEAGQKGIQMRQDGSCYMRPERYALLCERVNTLKTIYKNLGSRLADFDGRCYSLAAILDTKYIDHYKEPDAVEIQNSIEGAKQCAGLFYLTPDSDMREAGIEAYFAAQKLKCDTIPALFDELLNVSEDILFYERDNFFEPDERPAALRHCYEKFNKTKEQIEQASALAQDIMDGLESASGSYSLELEETKDGKLAITKVCASGTRDLNEQVHKWVFGKESKREFVVSPSVGAVEKERREWELRGLGFDIRKTYANGQTKISISFGRGAFSYSRDYKNKNTELDIRASILSLLSKIDRWQDDKKLRMTTEATIGRAAVKIRKDDEKKKATMHAGADGLLVKTDIEVEMLDELYHLLTAQATVGHASADIGVKGLAGVVPIPSFSAKAQLVDGKITAGVDSINLLSIKGVVKSVAANMSLENTAMKIGDKIFAKVRDGSDVNLSSDALVNASRTDKSLTASVGNNYSWFVASADENGLEFTPATRDGLNTEGVINIFKDLKAMAEAVKDDLGTPVDEHPETNFIREMADRLSAIENITFKSGCTHRECATKETEIIEAEYCDVFER